MPKLLFSKEYEDYLITGSEDSINSLPSGSLEKEYFLIIRQLLKEDLTPELETKIDDFTEKLTLEQSYRLKALHIFKKLKTNPEKKEEIIEEIKDLFNISKVTNYSKPVKYNKSPDEDNMENEAQKLPHELNLEKYIVIDKFIEDVYKGTIIPNDNEYEKAVNRYSRVDLNLDFNKIPVNTLVKIFTTEREFSEIKSSIQSSFKTAKFSNFKNAINLTIKEISKDKQRNEYFQDFFESNEKNLLTEQIEYLLTFNSEINFENLIPELISRKFPQQSEDKKERIKVLKEIKTLLNNYKYKYNKIARNVLLSILELNYELNIYELDIFIEYIELPIYDEDSMYNITPKIKEQIKLNDKQKELNV